MSLPPLSTRKPSLDSKGSNIRQTLALIVRFRFTSKGALNSDGRLGSPYLPRRRASGRTHVIKINRSPLRAAKTKGLLLQWL
jgi:hypothetical protein